MPAAAAAIALAKFGPRAEPAIANLTRRLDDPHSPLVLRRAAAEALGAGGPAASSAVPALRRAATSSDWPLRRRAEAALRAIEK